MHIPNSSDSVGQSNNTDPSIYSEVTLLELHAMLESISDAVYIGNVNGITLANQVALDQLGFTTREELNRNIGTLAEEIKTRDALTGEFIPAERQAFARALGGEWVTQDVLVRHRLRDEDMVVRCAASPVILNGTVIAAIAVNTDVTEQRKAEAALKENEAQQAFLLHLSDFINPLGNPIKIQDAATRLLGEHLSADRTYFVWTNEETQLATVERDYVRDEASSLVGEHPLSAFESMLKVTRTGRPFIANDVLDINGLKPDLDIYLGLQLRAFVCMPLIKSSKLLATMCVSSSTPREWTENDIKLLKETAERTLAAVERARTEELLRENQKRQTFLLTLSDALRTLSDPVVIQETTTRLLGEHLGVERTYYAWCDEVRQMAMIERDYYRSGSISLAGVHQYEDFGEIVKVIGKGGEFIANDVMLMPEVQPQWENYIAIGLRSLVAIPLIKNGVMVAAMAITDSVPRTWTRNEILLLKEVGERTWAAVEQSRAEKALLESEERFRSFVATSSDLVYRLSPDCQEMDILSGRDLKMNTEEPIKNWLTTYIPSHEHLRVRTKINQAIREKKMFELEYEVVKTDGSAGWSFSRAVPILDKQGSIQEWIGTASDITARKAAEQQLQSFNVILERKVNERTAELKEKRDQLQSVLDTTLTQISILQAVRDKNGAIVDMEVRLVNKEHERALGRSNLIGKRYVQEYPGMRQSGLFDLVVKTIESGQPQQAEYFYPYEGFNKWFSTSFVKLNDGVVSTNLDITARKQAEQERFKNYVLLQQSEELALLGNWDYDLVNGVFTWSNGMYRLFNLEKEIGVAPEIYLKYSTESGRPAAERVLRHLRQGDTDFSETLEIDIDGQVKVLHLKATVIRNNEGQPVRVLGVDMDITASRKAEEKIRRMTSEQQREIFRVTLSSQEEERRRISESLHNGLGQLLYAIKISMTHVTQQLAVSKPEAYNATSTKTENLVKAIDQQLKAIIKKDIRKIDNVNIRCAAFLQLIAA